MGTMLGWHIRSARRNVCRYGCCMAHEHFGWRTTRMERTRDKRVWKKEVVKEKEN